MTDVASLLLGNIVLAVSLLSLYDGVLNLYISYFVSTRVADSFERYSYMLASS